MQRPVGIAITIVGVLALGWSQAPPAALVASEEAPEPAWEPVGRIDDPSLGIGGTLVGFDAGYVAAGDGADAAWLSALGEEWQASAVAQPIAQPCPQSPPDFVAHDGYVTRGATNGPQVILLGGGLAFTAETCSDPDAGFGTGAVAWISSDGLDWARSGPFGGRHAVVDGAWWTPGGWEVALSAFDRPPSIWASPDGLAWTETLTIPGSTGESLVGAGAPDGIRLVRARSEDGRSVLLRSGDGVDWEEVEAPFLAEDDSYVSHIVAPIDEAAAWLVVVQAWDPGRGSGGSTVWISMDLEAWASSAFEGPRAITRVVATSVGFVASAEVPCPEVMLLSAGAASPATVASEHDCRPRRREFISSDGVAWTIIGTPARARTLLAEGPAGILAVNDDGGVFRLRP
jgi:hypothetical protein